MSGAEEAPQRVGRILQGNDFVDSFLTASYFGEFDKVLTSQFQVSNNAGLNAFEATTTQDEFYHQRDEIEVTKKLLEYRERFSPMSFSIAKDAIRWDLDRQRREHHNKLERRRRYFINAKISELGNMLPEHIGRAVCNRKGPILSETVEYIKRLRRDQELVTHLERKIEDLDFEFRKITDRLERLEVQSFTSLINACVDHIEDEPIHNETPSAFYLSPNHCTSTQNTTNMHTLFTQSKELDKELNGTSSFFRDDSTIFLPQATFPDTLCNLF